MLAILELVFSSFWTFIGTVILIGLLIQGTVAALGAITLMLSKRKP